MERRRSSSSAKPSGVTEPLRNLVNLGWQAGGIVFVLVTGYLLWGMLSDSMLRGLMLPEPERLRVVKNIVIAGKILAASGIVLVICACIRYYDEETLGYILIIFAAALYWGIPSLVDDKISRYPQHASAQLMYILGQFKLVGIVGMVLSSGFILFDIYLRLSGVRKATVRRATTIPAPSYVQEKPRSRLYLSCWQMPFCRDAIRQYCTAWEQRRTCWRLKSGCYCDEEMVLKIARKQQLARGFDIRFSETATRRKDLTPAEKRERCRNCFLYAEHQKQKYKILSPLVFPLAFAIMWYIHEPLRGFLHKAIEFSEHFAEVIRFMPVPEGQSSQPWTNLPSTSNAVEWLLMFCLGLLLVTYMLRILEYLIFKLQI